MRLSILCKLNMISLPILLKSIYYGHCEKKVTKIIQAVAVRVVVVEEKAKND